MAQAQPTRGDVEQQLQAAQQGGEVPQKQQQQVRDQAAIRYGDVFAVTDDLAGQPISPRDAAAMRSAEDSVTGVQAPGAAAAGFSAATAMETVAAYNQGVGAVGPGQARASDAATVHGIAVTQTAVPGGRVVTEFVAGQVVGQYSVADPPPPVEEDAAKITIGEALEAAARAGGGRTVDDADSEAIRRRGDERARRGRHHARRPRRPRAGGGAQQQAGRARRRQGQDSRRPLGTCVRAREPPVTGTTSFRMNPWNINGVVVAQDATAKLAGDKAAGTEDATRVVQAEKLNGAGARARAGGVGAAVATAARLNQDNALGDA